MIQLFNYTELMEKSGKKYLFDPAMFEQRKAQLEKLQSLYLEAFSILRDCKFRIDVSAIEELLHDGEAALERLAAADVEDRISGLSLPAAIAELWRKSSLQEIRPEIWKRADTCMREHSRQSEGIPLNAEDVTVSENGVSIDVEAVTDRIRQGCQREITPKDEDNAKCV